VASCVPVVRLMPVPGHRRQTVTLPAPTVHAPSQRRVEINPSALRGATQLFVLVSNQLSGETPTKRREYIKKHFYPKEDLSIGKVEESKGLLIDALMTAYDDLVKCARPEGMPSIPNKHRATIVTLAAEEYVRVWKAFNCTHLTRELSRCAPETR
jgi:hypothetical protein